MTFIQPNKNTNLTNVILVLLAVGVVAGVFGMVVLYNATVNLSDNIATMKAKLDTIGAESTTLSNQVIAALGSGNLTAIAAADGLVQDTKPQYFQANQAWPIASQ